MICGNWGCRRGYNGISIYATNCDQNFIPSSVERMLESLATSEMDISLAICALTINKVVYIYALTIVCMIVRVII